MNEDHSADRYRMFAAYNGWANERLYAAAARLEPAHYRADRGAFFGSVHGTLNHLLVADRIWLLRLTGEGTAVPLNTIVIEEFDALRAARAVEDARFTAFAAPLDTAALNGAVRYANSSGARFAQRLDVVLDHVFNHQTHHRGQVHALLTAFLGKDAGPSLDLIAYQREHGIGFVDAG
ncbi:MAG: DinB family protein [Xanthobacteraceae bacterium]